MLPLFGGRGLKTDVNAAAESFDFRRNLSQRNPDEQMLCSTPYPTDTTPVGYASDAISYSPCPMLLNDLRVTQARLRVQTAVAGQKLYTALYRRTQPAQLRIVPGSRVTTDLGSTGVKTHTFATPLRLNGDTQYWLGFISTDINALVEGVNIAGMPINLRLYYGTTLPQEENLDRAHTFGATIPCVVYLSNVGQGFFE